MNISMATYNNEPGFIHSSYSFNHFPNIMSMPLAGVADHIIVLQ